MDAASTDLPLVEMRGISKAFAGVHALDGVDLTIRAGGVHAVLGENGAGKSTLVRILSGSVEADSGSIIFEGRPIELRSPIDAARVGIATIYQELLLCPNLSIAANVFLGHELCRRPGLLDEEAMAHEAARILREIGLDLDPRITLSRLSVAQRQLVEIARGVRRRSRLLILDEPTAALSKPEIAQLFGIIRQLRVTGRSVIYISHRLEEIFEIADYITVMRDGRVVESLPTTDADEALLVRAMVGRELETEPRRERPQNATRRKVLEVHHLSTQRAVRDVSLEISSGEVVGLVGLVGSGRTELLRAIFGLDRTTAGTVTVAGQTYRHLTPRASIRAGLAYTSEDRKLEGIFPNFSVREHLSLSALGRYSRLGWVRRHAEAEVARRISSELDLRPRRIEVNILTLSGGNQQKVTIGRCLLIEPRVLLLDEPTRGVDVEGKAEIRRLIREFAARGGAVIFISSEIPELLVATERILVLKEGRLVAERLSHTTNQEELLALAAGASYSQEWYGQ